MSDEQEKKDQAQQDAYNSTVIANELINIAFKLSRGDPLIVVGSLILAAATATGAVGIPMASIIDTFVTQYEVAKKRIGEMRESGELEKIQLQNGVVEIPSKGSLN
jgi:hypothetical protein